MILEAHGAGHSTAGAASFQDGSTSGSRSASSTAVTRRRPEERTCDGHCRQRIEVGESWPVAGSVFGSRLSPVPDSRQRARAPKCRASRDQLRAAGVFHRGRVRTGAWRRRTLRSAIFFLSHWDVRPSATPSVAGFGTWSVDAVRRRHCADGATLRARAACAARRRSGSSRPAPCRGRGAPARRARRSRPAVRAGAPAHVRASQDRGW